MVILFRAYGTEDTILKMSEPALILVDVDWDATGISTSGRQNRCIAISRRLWRVEVGLAFEIISNYFIP